MLRHEHEVVKRFYTGTPSNPVVTEVVERVVKSPKATRKYRQGGPASPTREVGTPRHAHASATSPHARSPSPQQRYSCDPLDLPEHRPTSHFDHSYHQSQKTMRESHLEERCSSLKFELESLKGGQSKFQRQADAALSKCERMERDHEAMETEQDAFVKRAADAEDRLAKLEDSDEAKAQKRLAEQFQSKSQECTDLRAQLAAVLQERDEAQTKLQSMSGVVRVTPKSSRPAVSVLVESPKSSGKPSLDALLRAFDKLDRDSTGFAPRLDLRKAIDKFDGAQTLSDVVRSLDVMVLDREDFIEIVNQWLDGGSAPQGAKQAKTLRESCKSALYKVFEELDEDETEFAPRLDLRKGVEKYIRTCAECKQLADYIRALDVMIVEKDDYEKYVTDWIEGTLE